MARAVGDVSAEEPEDFRKKLEAAARTGPLWSGIPSALNGRGASLAVQEGRLRDA